MKKSTIWLLISILVVVFIALIAVEISYMRSIIGIHTADFDSAVHRSLARVAYFLERDETQRYLDLELEERDRQVLSAQSTLRDWTLVPPHSMGVDSISFDFSILTNPAFHAYLNQRAQQDTLDPERFTFSLEEAMNSESLKDKYLRQKDLLNDVVLRILQRAGNKPLEQRLEFAQLQTYLDAELAMQGLSEVPYHYILKDKNGQVVYISENFEDYHEAFPWFNYRQELFANDPGYEHPLLCVWFPTRDEYRHTSLGIFIPTLALSFVLMFVSVLVVMSFLRQKSFSDMKSDFISNMTHELKTPVSSISLAAQMLSDEDVAKSPTVMNHISSVIVDESKRLSMLVEKVLQLSMFSKKENKTINFRALDLNEIVDVVVQTFKLKVEKSGGSLHTNLQAGNTFVLADEMHITNVLFNLLDNAMKYRSDKRDLQLNISTSNIDDKFIQLAVSDNGQGIAREDIKKVFDRFFRAQKGNVHNVQGFGLGLAYVQMIIQKHHGEISVESELGQGTTFYIILPTIKTD